MGENVSVLMRAARSLRDRRTLSWAIVAHKHTVNPLAGG